MFPTNLVSSNSSLKNSIYGLLDWPRRPEIESIGLGFHAWKPSPKDSIFMHGNRAQQTRFSNAVVRFQQPRKFKNEEERSNEWNQVPIVTKPRRRKLQAMQNAERHVRSAPGFHRFCIVTTARHVRWGVLHRLKLSPPGFGHNRHLGSFVASFFFIFEFFGLLESHHCVAKSSPLGSVSMHENRVHWARFPCMKTESSRLDFFA